MATIKIVSLEAPAVTVTDAEMQAAIADAPRLRRALRRAMGYED